MSSSVAFNSLPIELNQNIGSLLDSDKDLASFRLICKSTNDAIDADGCSFWRLRFKEVFEAANLKLTGDRKKDGEKHRTEYQLRKSVLHVIDPAFQVQNVKPKLQFNVGSAKNEQLALRVLRDLIVDAFGDKKGSEDIAYESKNIKHILQLTRTTNLLQILGHDNERKNEFTEDSLFLYTIQSLLAPTLLSFDAWHYKHQSGFHGAQKFAYAHDQSCLIFSGRQGLDINTLWLIRNIQFWRHQFLNDSEPLCAAYEGLEDHERPQWWDTQLSQESREIGSHWKGSYAFVDRTDIKAIRRGSSGQGNVEHIQDQLNGEDTPYDAFQNIDLALSDPADKANNPWRLDFEHILKSLATPQSSGNAVTTRAQQSRAYPMSAVHDFRAKALRIEGDGTDSDEDFYLDGWLNPLPPQCGVPGWQRLTMMKYFIETNQHGEDIIDTDALWAYEGVMLPGGKVIIGRWWCPVDGTGVNMYSGPFILWNFESPEMDADDGCVPLDGYDETKETINTKGTNGVKSK